MFTTEPEDTDLNTDKVVAPTPGQATAAVPPVAPSAAIYFPPLNLSPSSPDTPQREHTPASNASDDDQLGEILNHAPEAFKKVTVTPSCANAINGFVDGAGRGESQYGTLWIIYFSFISK